MDSYYNGYGSYGSYGGYGLPGSSTYTSLLPPRSSATGHAPPHQKIGKFGRLLRPDQYSLEKFTRHSVETIYSLSSTFLQEVDLPEKYSAAYFDNKLYGLYHDADVFRFRFHDVSWKKFYAQISGTVTDYIAPLYLLLFLPELEHTTDVTAALNMYKAEKVAPASYSQEVKMLVRLVRDMFAAHIGSSDYFTRYCIGQQYFSVTVQGKVTGASVLLEKKISALAQPFLPEIPGLPSGIFDSRPVVSFVFGTMNTVLDGFLTSTLDVPLEKYMAMSHLPKFVVPFVPPENYERACQCIDEYRNVYKYCHLSGNYYELSDIYYDSPKCVDAEPVMVTSAMSNLLENYMRFSPVVSEKSIFGFTKIDPAYSAISEKYRYAVQYQIILFALRYGKFVFGDVRELSNVEINSDIYDELYFSHENYDKPTLRRIVENYSLANSAESSNGKHTSMLLILHGPPGSGKTTTVEALSGILKKPVYTFSQSSTSLFSDVAVEIRLSSITDTSLSTAFERCYKWNTVLFIDEADLFFHKRTSKDLLTTEIISLLEQVPIPVILACNNIEALDEALVNRSHIVIGYQDVKYNKDGKRFIWKNLLARNQIKGIDVEELVHFPLNGREIKNVLNVAISLSTTRDEITNALIERAIKSSRCVLSGGRSYYTVVNDSHVRFSDIIGLEDAKQDLLEISKYLRFKEAYRGYGAELPRGLLFVGKPGIGKTMVGKAFAREANAKFIYTTASSFNELYIGTGSKRVRELFTYARDNGPCVIFIDEIDAIGSRSGNRHDSGENDRTINSLLSELDGMTENRGIMIIAATNHPENLDPALTRSGRFDKRITFTAPSQLERVQMFRHYLRDVTLHADFQADFSSNLELLARKTSTMTGADIKNICNQAMLIHMQKLGDYKDQDSAPVLADGDGCTMADLFEAHDAVVIGNRRLNTVMTAAERELTAYHETGHAMIGLYLEKASLPSKMTILPRGESLGVTHFDQGDPKLTFRKELIASICIDLGGRAAEKLIYGDYTGGASGDYKNATSRAYQYFVTYNFGTRGNCTNPKLFSDIYQAQINRDMDLLISYCTELTEKILRENVDVLHVLARELVKVETMTYDDMIRLVPTIQKYAIENIPV